MANKHLALIQSTCNNTELCIFAPAACFSEMQLPPLPQLLPVLTCSCIVMFVDFGPCSLNAVHCELCQACSDFFLSIEWAEAHHLIKMNIAFCYFNHKLIAVPFLSRPGYKTPKEKQCKHIKVQHYKTKKIGPKLPVIIRTATNYIWACVFNVVEAYCFGKLLTVCFCIFM